MGRNARQSKIIDLISKSEIETQQELVAALIEAGHNVTQATISRDIKELGLIKVMSESKKYKYTLEYSGDSGVKLKMTNMFRESVLSIDYAENIIVIKTLSGSANSAASLIDRLGLENVLGCVAGDDTVLIVAKSVTAAKIIVTRLNSVLNS